VADALSFNTSYTRSVTRGTQRLEALLKVIVTPQVRYLSKKKIRGRTCLILILRRVQDPPEGFILNYTLLIGDASFSNFQKVRVNRRTGYNVLRKGVKRSSFRPNLFTPWVHVDHRLEGHHTRRTKRSTRLLRYHNEHKARTRTNVLSYGLGHGPSNDKRPCLRVP
jgi:hypothetical protein